MNWATLPAFLLVLFTGLAFRYFSLRRERKEVMMGASAVGYMRKYKIYLENARKELKRMEEEIANKEMEDTTEESKL